MYEPKGLLVSWSDHLTLIGVGGRGQEDLKININPGPNFAEKNIQDRFSIVHCVICR